MIGALALIIIAPREAPTILVNAMVFSEYVMEAVAGCRRLPPERPSSPTMHRTNSIYTIMAFSAMPQRTNAAPCVIGASHHYHDGDT